MGTCGACWNALFKEIPLLDPDAIANTFQATTSMLPSTAAARQVLKSAAEHLKKSKNFAIETTLSGRNYLQMMLDAKARGFEVRLVYIGTESVEINLARRNSGTDGTFPSDTSRQYPGCLRP